MSKVRPRTFGALPELGTLVFVCLMICTLVSFRLILHTMSSGKSLQLSASFRVYVVLVLSWM